jgi:hypothetical protein
MRLILISIFPALVVTWLVFGRYLPFGIPRRKRERRDFVHSDDPDAMTVGRRSDDNVGGESGSE